MSNLSEVQQATQMGSISVHAFNALMKDELRQSLVLDVGQAQTYARGHIPGAVHLPVRYMVRQEGYASGLAPTQAQLIKLAQDYGLWDAKIIYVYDDEGGGWAGRMAWLLDILQVKSVVYIDGGVRAWLKAGLPLETVRRSPVSSQTVQSVNWWPNLTLDEVIQGLQTQEFLFLDARSLGEYTGSRQFAQRAGHIPGALHFEWTRATNQDQGSILRPLNLLASDLEQLGVSQQKVIATYCQTHHRSGLTYLVCRLLGYEVRAYAGSWSEWGNLSHTPIETA